MIHRLQNTTLSHRVFKLIALNNLVLLQNFKSILLLSVFLCDQKYFSITSLADHGFGNEVFSGDLACLN